MQEGNSRKQVQIAWEEVARRRPPRFAKGDRLIVALAPLGSASIWKQRIPDASQRATTFAVADEGRAFVRRPEIGSTDTIDHFLQLPKDEQSSATGVLYLARLAALAHLDLARAAVVRLGQINALDSVLSPESRSQLIHALLRDDKSMELESRLLALLAERRLESMRPPLRAEIARRETPQPILYQALARVSGEIPVDHAQALLQEPDPALRAAAVRTLPAAEASDPLRRLARSDPDEGVRRAALERLVDLDGEAAVDTALDALRDPAPSVRGVAALALGRLGEPAVAGLRATA